MEFGPSSKVRAILGASFDGSVLETSGEKYLETAAAFWSAEVSDLFTRESIPGPAIVVRVWMRLSVSAKKNAKSKRTHKGIRHRYLILEAILFDIIFIISPLNN